MYLKDEPRHCDVDTDIYCNSLDLLQFAFDSWLVWDLKSVYISVDVHRNTFRHYNWNQELKDHIYYGFSIEVLADGFHFERPCRMTQLINSSNRPPTLLQLNDKCICCRINTRCNDLILHQVRAVTSQRMASNRHQLV